MLTFGLCFEPLKFRSSNCLDTLEMMRKLVCFVFKTHLIWYLNFSAFRIVITSSRFAEVLLRVLLHELYQLINLPLIEIVTLLLTIFRSILITIILNLIELVHFIFHYI